VADLFDWRLRKEIEQSRLDLIWTDLDVILTFANVVKTEYSIGNREHAERTLANAEKGYTDMLRYFSQARELTSEIKGVFQSKFKQVRDRLDGLQRLRER
jgi:hypothetical protein